MSETLEQIALRVAKEVTDECGIRWYASTIELEVFARRLVAALGAQEPVGWLNPATQECGIGVLDWEDTGCTSLFATPQLPQREGWQWVPKVATEEMIGAFVDRCNATSRGGIIVQRAAYPAMLAAAPKPEDKS